MNNVTKFIAAACWFFLSSAAHAQNQGLDFQRMATGGYSVVGVQTGMDFVHIFFRGPQNQILHCSYKANLMQAPARQLSPAACIAVQ